MEGSFMDLSLSLLLVAGITIGDMNSKESLTHFDNYTKAYRAAQILKQPMLVILNPVVDSGQKPISLGDIRRTKQRRELLEKYIIVVLDTKTEHGKTCHKLFGSAPLPRVVVIDKRQKYQIFQTSEALYGQLWTKILETYRKGERSNVDPTATYCPT